MEKDYYNILGVSRDASEADIKKAYKKLAMQYHPDRNKGDQKSEARFKEVNEAYQVLGDAQKKKNYDQFGSSDFSQMGGGTNPFGGFGGMGGNPAGFQGFEDLFSSFRGGGGSGGFGFDIGDMFGQERSSRKHETTGHQKTTPEELDVIKTIEIPFLDFLIDSSIDVETVYGKHLTLKIKAGTKPGTKYKITGKGRQNEGRIGDMYVIVDAKMPKEIPENIRPLLDAIRYQI